MKKSTIKKINHGIIMGMVLGIGVYTTALAAVAPTALPTGNTDVVGTNVVTTNGSVMTVKQDPTIGQAHINWGSFNIGRDATVNFYQPSSGATMINTVSASGGLSEIAGHMNSTGNIVLVNPNGVLFSNGAEVSVGGLAVYATAAIDRANEGNLTNQANITIDGGATIKAGVSQALKNLNAFSGAEVADGIAIDSSVPVMIPEDYKMGLNGYSNRIKLVANGNITIGDGATLRANDSTYVSASSDNLGEEGYSATVSGGLNYGIIDIRPDANSDDYGTLTINGDKVHFTTAEANIVTNPALAGVNTTEDGIKYNRKNYNDSVTKITFEKAERVYVNANADDDGSTILAAKDANTTAKYKAYNDGITGDVEVKMLINNVAQLQDIDPYSKNNVKDADKDGDKNNKYGNLAGNYALGKDINALADGASFIENGIIYKADKDGNYIAVSSANSGEFKSSTQKVENDGTIVNYTPAGTEAGITATTKDGVTYTKTGANSFNGNGVEYVIKTDADGVQTVVTPTEQLAFEKNTDGSPKLDADGHQIPVYKTDDQGNFVTDATGNKIQATEIVDVPVDADAAVIYLNLNNQLNVALTEFNNTAITTQLRNTIGTDANTMDSSKWSEDKAKGEYKGFDPIGGTGTHGSQDAHPAFTGSFDGYGVDSGHSINQLTIKRGDEDNVGLFGVVDGGHVGRTNVSDPRIEGMNNVGAIAGSLINGATVSWSHANGNGLNGAENTTTGFVKVVGKGERENIGGIAGLVDHSTISHSSNSVTVVGHTVDTPAEIVNVKHVGGIAGSIVNNATIDTVTNSGNVYGEEDNGGLVGYGKNSTIKATADSTDLHAGSYNNGQVNGDKDTGGIIGHATGVNMQYVFNTNEDKRLSVNSQYQITADGTIVKRGNSTTDATVNKNIVSADVLSPYGQINGKENTGGIVGYMENYSGTNADGTAVNKTSTIDTAYNAGNVIGTTDVGGLVGEMAGGKITNAYNGDNNTVIVCGSESTIPEKVKKFTYSYTDTSDGTTKSFHYVEKDAMYYGFFTVDKNGTRHNYYFIPTDGTTSKGAGGLYVDETGIIVNVNDVADKKHIDQGDRYYFNRMAYKDANIKGDSNVGGLVGNMSAGSLETTYNAGTVTGTTAATTAALIGNATGGSIAESFYVKGVDASTGKAFSNQDKIIGTNKGATDDSNGATINSDVVGGALKEMRSRNTINTTFGNDSFLGTMVDRDTETGADKYTCKETVDVDNGDGTTTSTETTTNILWNGSTFYTYTTDAAGKITNKTEAFTKVRDGNDEYYKSTDPSDTTHYTLTKDTKTGEVTLKDPVGNVKVSYSPVMVASNQGKNWLVYEQQTLPLLSYYMNDISVSRVFDYDGSTHNLKTDDVQDLYGRADFSDGKGQMVNTQGEKESETYAGSSEYYYGNSSIWSPQHGYIMDALAAVTIIPVELKVTVTGERVYGDINTTTGYYVYVPYKVGAEQKYAFYRIVEEGTGVNKTQKYELLTDVVDGAQNLTDFFKKKDGTSYAMTAEGLKQKAKDDGTYVVELNGIISSEATMIGNTQNKVIENVLTSINTDPNAVTSGVDLKHIFSDDDQKMNAGDYEFAVGKGVTGLTATRNNYAISYEGNLTVEKANLYYTYDGERNYGESNDSKADTNVKVFKLVGIDVDSATTSVDGYLKSFDKDKLAYTTTQTIDGKDVYVLTGGNGATGTTTMTGVTPSNNINISSKVDADGKQIATAITQNTAGSYYEVMVDSTGKVLGYVLKTYDNGETKITGNAGDATYTEKVVNEDGTVTDVDKTISYTDLLNKNYNLVWMAGGDHTVRTSTATTDTTTGITTTNVGTSKIIVNDSTQKIKPIELTVSVNGERNYGDTMKTDDYTTSTTHLTTDKPTVTTTNNGKFNVNLDGLTDFDKTNTNILNKDNVLGIIAGVEGTYVSADDTFISDHTSVNRDTAGNVIAYDIGTTGSFDTDHAVNVTGKDSTSKHYNILAENNYNYVIVNGKHTEQIDPRSIVITSTGNKTYGDENSTAVYNDVTVGTNTGTGLTNWDAAMGSDVNNAITGLKGQGTLNGIDEKTHVGSYGTNGTATSKDTVISYAGVTDTSGNLLTKKVDDALGGNYIAVYKDEFTINKANLTVTINGNKTYGDANTTTKYELTAGTSSGLTSWDGDVFNTAIANNKVTGFSNSYEENINAGNYGTAVTTPSASVTGSLELSADGITALAGGLTDYNISFVDEYTVKQREITITSTGERTYGNATQASDYKDVTITTGSLATWDADAGLLTGTDGINATLKGKGTLDSSIKIDSDAGSYGTAGTNLTTGVITYDEATKTKLEETVLGNNYKVTYADKYTINKADLYYTYAGERAYGESNDATTATKKYTIVGTDASDGVSVEGYLKNFDIGKTVAIGATGTSTIKGTITTANSNVAANGAQLITANRSGDNYTDVLVDTTTGDIKAYNVTSYENTAIAFTGDDKDALSKNYNLVWKAGGNYTANTVTATATADGTTVSTGTKTVTVNNSTQTINPVTLKVTVNGERTYGDTMSKTEYTTSTTTLTADKPAVTTNNNAKFNVNVEGLTNGDTTTAVLNGDTIIGLIGGVETGYSETATNINERTNVGTYKLDGLEAGYTGSKVDVTTDTNGHANILVANNYNYTLENGAHTETIVARKVTINTTANRTYGTTPTTVNGTVTTETAVADGTTGLMSWDTGTGDDTTAGKVSTALSGQGSWNENKITSTSNVGTYNNVINYSTAGTNGVDAALGSNYEAVYTDKVTVGQADLIITIGGIRVYGDDNSKATYTFTAGNELLASDQAAFNDAVGKLVGTDGKLINANNVTNTTITSDNADTYGTANGKTKVLTIGTDAGSSLATDLSNYNIQYADGFEITKRKVTITSTGERTYGNAPVANNFADVTVEEGDATKHTGLMSWDDSAYATAEHDGKNISTTVKDTLTGNGTDKTYTVNADGTTPDSNVGTYGTNGTSDNAYKDGAIVYSGDQVNTIAGIFGDNYEVEYADSMTITPRKLVIHSTGNRTYGQSNADATYKDITIDGMMSWDSGKTTAINTELKGNGTNHTGVTGVNDTVAAANSHVGIYGTEGTAGLADGAITYDDDQKAAVNDILKYDGANSNYVVKSYEDSFEIKKANLTITTSGTKIYGDSNDGMTYTASSTLLNKADQNAFDAIIVAVNNTADKTLAAGSHGTANGETNNVLQVTNKDTYNSALSDYEITFADDLTVNKREVTITSTGNRTYGNENSTSEYDDVTVEKANGSTGLMDWDENNYNTAHTGTTMYDDINNTLKGNGKNNAVIKQNVGRYGNTTGATDDASVAKTIIEYNASTKGDVQDIFGDNYTIKYADKFDITKRVITIDSAAERTYGDATVPGDYKDLTVSSGSIAPCDGDKLTAINNALKGQGTLNSSITDHSNAGTYGTGSITYSDEKKDNVANDILGGNYEISYTDSITINARPITISASGSKEYGTGNEHSSYSDINFGDMAAWDKEAFKNGSTLVDNSDRTTNVGNYHSTDGNGLLQVNTSGVNSTTLGNYAISYDTDMTITAGNFTFTATPTEYWQGEQIPAQSGTITNKYGEDVSDLVGTPSWKTPATPTSMYGYYEIIGSGTNDGNGNYFVVQADGNDVALHLKPKQSDIVVEGNRAALLLGAWGPARTPLLDVRYFTTATPQGINRWDEKEEEEQLGYGELHVNKKLHTKYAI